MSASFKYIKENGIHHESNLPYKAKDGTCIELDKEKEKIHNYVPTQGKSMLAFLTNLSYRPLTVAYFVSNASSRYKGGIMDADEEGFGCDVSGVNHGVLATGYKIDLEDLDQSYIEFKNQWGTWWGENGYFKFKLKNVLDGNGPCNILKHGSGTYFVNINPN